MEVEIPHILDLSEGEPRSRMHAQSTHRDSRLRVASLTEVKRPVFQVLWIIHMRLPAPKVNSLL